MCAFSFKSRLSRALSNRCVFDKNAQRFSEDGRPKRIEMYAKTQTSTKCKRKRISIFVHCISIGRTELQTFSKKTNYDQSRTYNIPSPFPPKILRNLVFAFSWDDCNTQEKVRKIALQNLGGSQCAL